MNISGIGSSAALFSTLALNGSSSSVSNISNTNALQTNALGSSGADFMSSILQALKSTGIDVSGGDSISISIIDIHIDNSSASNSGHAGGNQTGAGSEANQALYALMAHLFQALTQSGGQSLGTGGGSDDNGLNSISFGGIKGYNNLSANLQQLINSLSGDQSSNHLANLLRGDLSNLYHAVGGAGSAQAPNLHEFLSNLSSSGNSPSTAQSGVGSIVSIRA